MTSHPLGAWVCKGRAGLIATHVPFFLDRSRVPCGTLIGHVSRANPVWRELDSASPRAPWSVSDAPAPFMERMMRAIVGIEIPIDRLEGKLKASQDEAMPDHLRTVRGLRELGCDVARAMAALVRDTIDADAANGP